MFKPTADILRRVFAREKAPAPEVTVAKAKRFQELLDDPIFRELFADLEIVILRQWSSSAIRDKEGQFALRLKLQTLHDLRRMAEKRVELGKIEVYKDKVATKISRLKPNG